MSRPDQLDLHPGAESLNAFVEHVLPEQERQQLLLHLSACPQCREVVFLAQDAAANSEPEVVVQTPALAKPRTSWLTGWRPVWVMATACAAVLALSLPVFFRHAAQVQQSARMAQSDMNVAPAPSPASPRTQEKPDAHPLAPTLSKKQRIEDAKTARSTLPAAGSLTAAKPRSPAAKSTGAPQPPAKAAASASPPSAPPVASATESVMVAPAMPIEAPQIDTSRPAITATIPSQPTLSVNPQAQQNRSSSGASTSRPFMRGLTSSARAGMVARPAMPARTNGLTVAGAARSLAAAPARATRLMSPTGVEVLVIVPAEHISAGSEEELTAARDAMRSTLPNGHAPVFASSAQRHLLAIDSAGALFLSNDAGKSWEPIPPQWAGRAVSLRVAPSGGAIEAGKPASQKADDTAAAPTPAAAPNATAANTPDAQQAPATTFEITDESGAIWTSVDGRIWTPK